MHQDIRRYFPKTKVASGPVWRGWNLACSASSSLHSTSQDLVANYLLRKLKHIRYLFVCYGSGTLRVFHAFLHHVGTGNWERVNNSQTICVRQERSILIIDDDVDFCCLLEIAFQEAHVCRRIEIVYEGWAAVEHLRQLCGVGVGNVAPALILLDLRMPGLNGLDVLKWIRGQPFFREVPVVVFTGLEAGGDHSEAISLGATSLRLKPFSYRDLVKEAGVLRDTYLEDHFLKDAA